MTHHETIREYNYLKFNEFEIYENLLATDLPTKEDIFLNVDDIRTDRYRHDTEEDHVILYEQNIELSKKKTCFEREQYSLIDFFGD